MQRIQLTTFLCCAVLLASGAALAQGVPRKGTTPADPTNTDNQMILRCMEQQDPALKKEDAVLLCKKKLKQGIDVGRKPKPKRKPPESQPPPAPPPG